MSFHVTLRPCIGRIGNERAVSFATSKIVRQAVREPQEKRPVARSGSIGQAGKVGPAAGPSAGFRAVCSVKRCFTPAEAV